MLDIQACFGLLEVLGACGDRAVEAAHGHAQPVAAALRREAPGVLDLGCTVGVRPEHLRIFPADGAPEGALRAHVDIVVPLGAETLVHAILDGRNTPIVARAPGSTHVRHGDVLALVPDMEKAVKFD